MAERNPEPTATLPVTNNGVNVRICHLCDRSAERRRNHHFPKRMFGEYGLYCDQVFFGVICDDQLFIKITPPVAESMPDCPKAPPYAGAKESFLIEDLDDREKLGQIVRMTCEHLPKPKPRKPKKEN